MEKKLKVSNFDNFRAAKIINETKANLNVNLEGYTVLTEVGSNLYLYSPIIPLLCGASKVLAFVKDTSYGSAENIKELCFQIANELGFSNKLQIATNILPENWLTEADIVTNSGMLRPFDRKKIIKFKKGAVLPLMFEAWEVREQDLDIGACKEYGISVAGTWENHPLISVFDNVKMLCLKLAFEAGYEIMGNSILVWSDDHFGEMIEESFNSNGVKKCIVTTDVNILYDYAPTLDFIFIADYDEKRDYTTLFDINNLVLKAPNLGIIHLYGLINLETFKQLGFKVYPTKNGASEMMSFTLAHVGMMPYLNLQVGGYKVAQCLLEKVESELIQIL